MPHTKRPTAKDPPAETHPPDAILAWVNGKEIVVAWRCSCQVCWCQAQSRYPGVCLWCAVLHRHGGALRE